MVVARDCREGEVFNGEKVSVLQDEESSVGELW